jgi:hypothetical protein
MGVTSLVCDLLLSMTSELLAGGMDCGRVAEKHELETTSIVQVNILNKSMLLRENHVGKERLGRLEFIVW